MTSFWFTCLLYKMRTQPQVPRRVPFAICVLTSGVANYFLALLLLCDLFAIGSI